MSPDRLKERLKEVAAPQATRARERTVAAARAEVERRAMDQPANRSALSPWRPFARVAAAVLVIAAVLLTPLGRAASAWVGDLVGIGDVGGPPSQERQGDYVKRGTAVVISNGAAPEGTRYEWVAFECRGDTGGEDDRSGFEGIGLSLQWPGVKGHEGGGSCESLVDRPTPGALASHGVQVVPSQFKGVAEPDLVIAGTTGPAVHSVRVIYTDAEGNRSDLPVRFARVEGKLRELAGRPEELGTFMAFLPGNVAARDEVESRLDLRALYGTPDFELGRIGREERAQAREAFLSCGPLEAEQPSQAKACYEEKLPQGPIEYVAYDANGKVLERTSEPVIALVRPPDTIPAEGREEPGDKRRPAVGEKGFAETNVLMTGRAPDGALYEFFIRDTSYGFCFWILWPYAEYSGSGSCGDALPPSTAYGSRNMERAFARYYASLEEAPRATSSRYIKGFARPNVERVEVHWRDAHGRRHLAPVDLVAVTQASLGGMRLTESFKFWIAFVPRSAGYRPLDFTAYDASGAVLGRTLTKNRP